MKLSRNKIKCQVPVNNNYIDIEFNVVDVELIKGSEEYINILNESKKLAGLVNSGAASDSAITRDDELKLKDSFGGLLSEKAWLQYINEELGNIASLTVCNDAKNQIDIVLKKGETIEVRSSFIRNGVKFGVCSKFNNFKNIGPYSNSIKPGEIQKNFYCGVLFETQKKDILTSEIIKFSLVGSSTWEMILNDGFNTHLNAWDGFAIEPGNYRVLEYMNTLDTNKFIEFLKSIGY